MGWATYRPGPGADTRWKLTRESKVEIGTEKLIQDAVADAIREGVKKKLTDSYDNPLSKMLNTAIAANEPAFRKLLETSIATCLNDADFSESIRQAVRQSLAKTLVQRFGGELEKQVNALKSDPTTRARIIIALEEIVKKNTPE